MQTPMKTYSFDEFLEIQKTQKHPHVGLYGIDGARIVSYNPNGKPAKDKIDEIKRALENPALPESIYVIRGKASLVTDAQAFEYPIIKGDPSEIDFESLNESEQKNETFKEFNPSVTSYQNVLDLNIELERLKLENKALLNENDQLKGEIEELTAEMEKEPDLLNEEPNDFLSNAGKFLENLVPMLNPVIEKHYELKEKAIQLEYHKMQAREPRHQNNAPQINEPPMQQDAVKHTLGRIQEYIETEDDDDNHEKMVSLYNNAENLDHFFITFKETMGEEKLNDLTTFINE